MKFIPNCPDLVQRKTKGGLTLLKYKKKVFFDNLWGTSDDLLECRGRVVDQDNNVIVNPFTKVFNYQENGTTIPEDEVVLAVEKRNGFMASLTFYKGEWLYTTTGSFDSAFVDLAKKYIGIPKFEQYGVTFLFEVCAVEDPHIIEEEVGAYLIGMRYNHEERYTSNVSREEYLNLIAEVNGWKRPDYFEDTFANVLALSKVVKHEGFCVYGETTNLKLKSPYYLQTKAIARSNRRLFLDEEFTGLLKVMPKDLTERERIDFIRNYFK